MELDQRSIAVYLYLQKKAGIVIHDEMKNTLGDLCVSYSAITKYIRNYKIGSPIKTINNKEILNVQDQIDHAILEVLENEPFLSVRQIAKLIDIPKSTVYYHLTERLGFVSKHLKWVPHLLNDYQKKTRVDISKELLKILQSAKRQGWKYFATGDESWFYLSYDYERQWVVSGDEPATRPKKMIGSEKVLITVFWNPNQILLIDALPKGEKFNAQYYCDNILENLYQIGNGFPDTNGKRLCVHVDNARPHTARMTTQYIECHGMKKVPHPPYSPDIAPSDFFLFGYMKEAMKGHVFASRDELLLFINHFLKEISKDILSRVFLNWEERLINLINSNGAYVD